MPYLRETLASQEAQTYRDWEVLAWDNGSAGELDRWVPHRLPGRVVRDRPLPLVRSLAAMVNAAETELCARIDGDDVCLPDRLERQVAFMRSPPEVAVVGSQYEVIDDAGAPAPGGIRLPTFHRSFRSCSTGGGYCIRRS